MDFCQLAARPEEVLPGRPDILVYGEDAIDGQQRARSLFDSFVANPVLQLRKGAKVISIANMGDSVVNGTLGVLSHFLDISQSFFSIDPASLPDGVSLDYAQEWWPRMHAYQQWPVVKFPNLEWDACQSLHAPYF